MDKKTQYWQKKFSGNQPQAKTNSNLVRSFSAISFSALYLRRQGHGL